MVSRKRRDLVSDYFNEPIFYGGLICTRVEAIRDMEEQGLNQQCIDRYLQGNASTPFPPEEVPDGYDGPVAYPIGITPAARGEGPNESIAHYFVAEKAAA